MEKTGRGKTNLIISRHYPFHGHLQVGRVPCNNAWESTLWKFYYNRNKYILWLWERVLDYVFYDYERECLIVYSMIMTVSAWLCIIWFWERVFDYVFYDYENKCLIMYSMIWERVFDYVFYDYESECLIMYSMIMRISVWLCILWLWEGVFDYVFYDYESEFLIMYSIILKASVCLRQLIWVLNA